MSNLQRMIVIPPEIFDKWKHIIVEDKKLTELDKNMKNILYNKSLNDINKWHRYNENLLKYSFAKKDKCVFNSPVPVPVTSESSTQTHRIYQKDKEVQQGKSGPMIDKNTQTDKNLARRQQHWASPDKTLDEIFETSNRFQSIETDDVDNVNTTYNESNSYDEDEIKRQVLLGQPNDVRITKERLSSDPRSSFKIFELNNGDCVTVPIKVSPPATRSRSAHTKSIQPPIPFRAVKTAATSKRKPKAHKSSTPTKAQKLQNPEKISWNTYQ